MAKVRVMVTLKPSLLDSAGQTVSDSLGRLGFGEVRQVRIGRLVEIEVDHYSEERVREMCDRLLANPVIEDYRIEAIS
jgi:phosphoribosylformylglycinamidine synthase